MTSSQHLKLLLLSTTSNSKVNSTSQNSTIASTFDTMAVQHIHVGMVELVWFLLAVASVIIFAVTVRVASYMQGPYLTSRGHAFPATDKTRPSLMVVYFQFFMHCWCLTISCCLGHLADGLGEAVAPFHSYHLPA